MTAALRGLLKEELNRLQERYHLDFAGHLDELYHGTVLHRTIEHMRKH